jgi:hypothetical protein
MRDSFRAYSGKNCEEMGRTDALIRVFILQHSSNQGKAESAFMVTKHHIACVNKLEKWSLRTNDIDQVLQRFHTEPNPGNIGNKW